MPKGVKRSMAFMSQGAISAQKDEEIEALKQKLAEDTNADGVREIRVDEIYPLRIEVNELGKMVLVRQPRTYFDPEKIEELKASIGEKGLQEPIHVRLMPDGGYEILDGERRWRSHIALKLPTIRAFVHEVDDSEALEYSLTSHCLKEKASLLEETISVINLLRLRLNMDESSIRSVIHAMNNAEIGNTARKLEPETTVVVEKVLNSLGIKLGALVARLPLLDLPANIRQALEEGKLSPTNAKIIARVPEELHQQLLEEGVDLSKRDLKALIDQKIRELNPGQESEEIQNGFADKTVLTTKTIGEKLKRIGRSKVIKNAQDETVQGLLQEIYRTLERLDAYVKTQS